RSMAAASDNESERATGSTVPALLISRYRAASAGRASLRRCAAASIEAVCDRSACSSCRRAPCRAATSASSGFGLRARVMTVTPEASSCAASAWPRPRLAPVTTATAGEAFMASDSLFEAGDDEGIEIAVEHLLRVGNFDVGAQVLDPALVQHVGADLMPPAHIGLRIFQLLLFRHALAQFQLVKLGLEHLHRLGTVAMLRAVVLTLNDDTGGHVRDTHGRIGLVDVLTAGAAGPVSVDAQVGR